jgi:hypothetical protein
MLKVLPLRHRHGCQHHNERPSPVCSKSVLLNAVENAGIMMGHEGAFAS